MSRPCLWEATPALRSTAAFVLLASCLGAAAPAQTLQGPSGLFRRYAVFPTAMGLSPEAVAIGDLTGDGRNDVAMVALSQTAGQSTLLVYAQSQAGALGSPVSYAVGYSDSLALGDLDADGRLDVVVGNSTTIGVLVQDGSGALRPMVEYPVPATTAWSFIVETGDFDTDGRTDVVAIAWGNDAVVVYLQNASGTLDPGVLYHVAHGGYDDVDVGDVNLDGRDDIVVMSGQIYAIPNLGVLLQRPEGGFEAPVHYDIGVDDRAHGVAVGDVDGDSREDVVVTYDPSDGGSGYAVFRQNESGTLAAPLLHPCTETNPCSGGMQSVEVADVDGDGRRDVLVLQGSFGGLRLELQKAGGSLVTAGVEPLPYASWYNPQGLAIGDVDGDGLADIAVAAYGHGLAVLRQSGCRECVRDGGFEGGIPNASWEEYSFSFGTPLCTAAACGTGGGTAGPRSGVVWAWFGGVTGHEEVAYVEQDVVIPQGTASLRFHLWNGAWSGNQTDYAGAWVDGVTVFAALAGTPGFTAGYTPVTVDVSAFADGGQHELLLGSYVTGSRVSNFSVDDVSLQACSLPPAPVSIADSILTEGGAGSTVATFAVSLAAPSASTVKVSWATADETARSGADYAAASGILTFPPGATQATVSVTVLGDRVLEGRERFFVNLLDPLNGVLARGQAVGVIEDDDAAGFSVDDVTVTAPAAAPASAVFTVTLAPPVAEGVSVAFATTDGTAVGGVDYEPTSGTLTFPPGVQALPVPVSVLPNAQPAEARSFQLVLSGGVGAPIAWAAGTGMILSPGYHTLTPCRAFDTRAPLDGASLAAHATRTIRLAGRCGLPPTARSVALNVTVTQPTAAGHLRLFPAGSPLPPTSATNFAAGQTRANNGIFPLSTDGQLSIYSGQATGTAHVILDVVGYFTSE